MFDAFVCMCICVTRREKETVGRTDEKTVGCLLWVMGVFRSRFGNLFSRRTYRDRRARSRRSLFFALSVLILYPSFSLPSRSTFTPPLSPMPNAELYIYGGAFKGLPSIDPQCLALISYLSIVSHQEYTIVESNDPGISPTGTLQRSLPSTSHSLVLLLCQLEQVY